MRRAYVGRVQSGAMRPLTRRRPPAAVRAAAPLAVVTACALAVAACGGGSGSTPAAPSGDAQLQTGRQVYVDHCAKCHGTAGGGGAGPKLAGGRPVRDFATPAAQAAFMKAKSAAMGGEPARLSADELAAVVRYTREVLCSPNC